MAQQIEIRTDVAGKVWQIETQVGAQVAEGDSIVVLESMKMEIPVTAPHAGTITEIPVAEGDALEEGDIVALLQIE